MQEELRPHPRAAVTGPAGRGLLFGVHLSRSLVPTQGRTRPKEHNVHGGASGTRVWSSSHFPYHTLERQGRGQCGFILSAAWLGCSGRCSCFSGGGGDPPHLWSGGVLEPAFLSPGGQGPGASCLRPCPALWVEAGHLPKLAKVRVGPHSSPPFLSAGPVEAEQVLPGHNSSVFC